MTEVVETNKTISKKRYLLFLVILLVALIIYYFRDWIVVASVDGRPVFRLTLVSELEKRNGQEVLNSLITEKVILAEARKANITVTDQEVSDQLAKIETEVSSQGQELDAVLALQGMSRDDLEKQIRLQKLVEKLLGDRLNVTDEEVTKYLAENKEFLPKDQDEETLKATVREQLRQQKLSEEFQKWIEEVRANNEVKYFVDWAAAPAAH